MLTCSISELINPFTKDHLCNVFLFRFEASLFKMCIDQIFFFFSECFCSYLLNIRLFLWYCCLLRQYFNMIISVWFLCITFIIMFDSLFTAARQAVKNTPKRLPSVTMRSPLGASPTNLDTQADSSVSSTPMETEGITSDETSIHSVVRREKKKEKQIISCVLKLITLKHIGVKMFDSSSSLFVASLSGSRGRSVPASSRPSSIWAQGWGPGGSGWWLPTEENPNSENHTTTITSFIRTSKERKPDISQPPPGETHISLHHSLTPLNDRKLNTTNNRTEAKSCFLICFFSLR